LEEGKNVAETSVCDHAFLEPSRWTLGEASGEYGKTNESAGETKVKQRSNKGVKDSKSMELSGMMYNGWMVTNISL
jgi:hypothetical protein